MIDVGEHTGADLAKAIRDYGRVAAAYDRATRRIDRIRLQAIAALELAPGDVVLDAGCGTGWCIPYLARAVGARGLVIGFDPSAEMLAVAQYRLTQAGVSNAVLLQCEARDVQLTRAPDVILFSYTHDLLQSRISLEHVFAKTQSGARVAACGTKRFPMIMGPANLYQRYSHRRYITNFEGLKRPWAVLAQYLEGFQLDCVFPGNKYLASGRLSRRDAPSSEVNVPLDAC